MSNNEQFEEKLDRWIGEKADDSKQIELSVVIPAFNEQRRLPATLMELIDYLDPLKKIYEIIIVDDGSTDQTSSVVRRFERIGQKIRLIRLPVNYGKGHAVRVGMLSAEGARVLFADADGATPWSEIPKLLHALDSGADLAIGSRALKSTDTHVTTHIHRRLMGRIFNFFVNTFAVPGIADTQCGFKIFQLNVARFLFERQTANGFSFDVELLVIAQRAKLKIAEVPVNWENVPGSKVRLVSDSLKMLRDILMFRLRHRAVGNALFEAQSSDSAS